MRRRLPVIRVPRIAILVVCAIAACALSVAANQGEGTQPQLIEIQSTTVKRNKNGYDLHVKAKAPNVPSGTKIDFQLMWRSRELKSFQHTLKGARIEETFKVTSVPISTEAFNWATIIRGEKQTTSIRKKLRSDKKNFPPGLDPWTEYHMKQAFKIADPAQVAAEQDYIHDFFMDRMLKLAELRKRVVAEVEAAKTGESYTKKDELDTKKWRKFFDKDVLTTLRDMQKELADSQALQRFAPYQAPLALTLDMSKCVSVQVLAMSVDLYKEKGMDPAEMDTDSEKHKLLTDSFQRNPKSVRTLGDLFKQIKEKLPEKSEPPEKAAKPKKEGAPDKGKSGKKGQ